MPRGKKADFFGAIRAQAAKVLQQLEGQIRALEDELTELRGQLHQWRQLAGSGVRAIATRGPGRPRAVAARGAGGKRVKWDEVLAFLPKRFGVEDVMKHPGAAAKGRAQVYPALNRWETTKRVRRVGKGVYEKAGGEGAATPGATAKRGPGKKRGRRAVKRGKAAAAKADAAKAG